MVLIGLTWVAEARAQHILFPVSSYNIVELLLAKSMRVCHLLTLTLLLTSVASLAPSFAKDKEDKTPGRLLTGRVLDHQDNPVPDSVVYLSNVRTRAVKTYIVGANGEYDFPALSPNVDYEVYAEYKGRKTDTKTISQFDDRKRVTIILRLDTR
jgi:hypothetical protein